MLRTKSEIVLDTVYNDQLNVAKADELFVSVLTKRMTRLNVLQCDAHYFV